MRCQASTRRGTRCKRNVQEDSQYCYQHEKIFGNQTNSKKRLQYKIETIALWVGIIGSVASIVGLLFVFVPSFQPTTSDNSAKVLSFTLYVITWLGTCVGIFWLFEKAEDNISEDTKIAISLWLLGLKMPESLPSWFATFAAVFDRIFGKRHLSWRCFYRSCFASLLSVSMLELICLSRIFGEGIGGNIGNYSREISLVAVFAIYFNFLPDYVSLLETRYMIRWLIKSNSTMQKLFPIFIDFMATTLISFFTVAAFTFYGSFLFVKAFTTFAEIPLPTLHQALRFVISEPILFFEQVYLTYISGILFRPSVASLGRFDIPAIFIYSTYFTSLWVWLYTISGLVLKLFRLFDPGINFFRKVFDIENKPLRSIGYVSALLITLIYVIALIANQN